MGVHFEWVIETVMADEHEDIVDLLHFTRIRDLEPDVIRAAISNRRYVDEMFGEVFTRLALIRNKGDQVEGIVDRAYAYVDEDGVLPDEFEDSAAKVPDKFKAELYKETKASDDC